MKCRPTRTRILEEHNTTFPREGVVYAARAPRYVALVTESKVPTGRLGRIARLARVGARTGASLLMSKDSSGAAAHAAEILGNLRGLATKVGQMASYVDGFVPDAHRAAFEKALGGLRAAAPRSPFDAVKRTIETELRAPLEALFPEFEQEAFASASIGQVHRARLDDGRAVAVKVQHPGIDVAVEGDLASASIVESLVGALGPSGMGTKAVFDEIAARFREELDYGLEAQRQTTFAGMHAGDPFIRVPAVVQQRSSRRVLTTELVAGMTLDEASAASAGQRRHYAEVLWRFVFKGNLVFGLFNADPHPGNYLFGSDGTIQFLDFGCVQAIPEEHVLLARKMHRAAMAGDSTAFFVHSRQLLQTRGGAFEEAAMKYVRDCFEPLFTAPFHMTPEYVRGVVRGVMDLKQHVFSRDGSFAPLPPSIAMLNRLQFGFYSVLARLDAVADYAEVERRFLAEAALDT
jgi:predicted unusual protein kinase regulating ubiquinone biosynthesis (AarF/ABC1/UbiB family)